MLSMIFIDIKKVMVIDYKISKKHYFFVFESGIGISIVRSIIYMIIRNMRHQTYRVLSIN